MKHINAYRFDGIDLDSFDLKCMVVTKGATVDPAVVEAFQGECRISMDPRQFSNLYFSDGISAAMIDTGMNYDQNALRYNWTDEDRRIFEPQATSPFSVRLEGGRAALFYKDDLVDYVTFPKGNDYYAQTAPSGASFLDLSTLQGDEWDSWAYLWPCDYAINGEPCQYCHAGLWSAAEAAAGNPPAPVCAVEDFAAMADYAVKHAGVKSLQITGGSTFDGVGESEHLLAYLEAMAAKTGIETIALSNSVVPLLPYLLGFAAGAMLYEVVEELIPQMSEGEHSNVGVILFAAVFTLMMALDIALG